MPAPTLLEGWDWRRLHVVALRETRRLLDEASAQDAAQEALVRAWRRAQTCSSEHPDAWVRAIARREALRIIARRTDEEIADEYELAHPESGFERTEWRMTVASAAGGLSRDERRALLLRYWAGWSDRQIARILRTPVGTVKVRLYRAHRKLGLALGGDQPS